MRICVSTNVNIMLITTIILIIILIISREKLFFISCFALLCYWQFTITFIILFLIHSLIFSSYFILCYWLFFLHILYLLSTLVLFIIQDNFIKFSLHKQTNSRRLKFFYSFRWIPNTLQIKVKIVVRKSNRKI